MSLAFLRRVEVPIFWVVGVRGLQEMLIFVHEYELFGDSVVHDFSVELARQIHLAVFDVDAEPVSGKRLRDSVMPFNGGLHTLFYLCQVHLTLHRVSIRVGI